MLLGFVWLVVGLVVIMIGANMLTDGSASIARRFGMSDMLVGLTVIAFGTSAPELAISVIASAGGQPQIAIGNVVGSDIINILLIVGVTALIRPIKVEKSVMTAELPMLFICSMLLLLFGNSGMINGHSENMLMRTDGILLLLLFVLFIRYTISAARRHPAANQTETVAEMPVWRSLLYVVIGLVGLVWGGDRFVDGASAIAVGFGMSEALVGLTIVAVGTSLPELATSVVAAIKGHPGMVVGNVIGSNIFNALLVLGAAGTVNPLSFAGITNVSLLTLVGASLLFWVFARFGGVRVITRVEAAIMLLCFVAYTGYLIYVG